MKELHTYLPRTVVGQQLPSSAAESLWNRLSGHLQDRSLRAGVLLPGAEEDLREAGLSRAKIKAIIGVTETIDSGKLVLDELRKLSTDQLIIRLTGLWAIGRWLAEMTALFYLGLPDKWSTSDAAVNSTLQRVAVGSQKEQTRIIEALSGQRSMLTKRL